MTAILNQRDGMAYRRFGRTGRRLSVITQGGMRFKAAGGDPRDATPVEAIDHCAACIRAAWDAGINHFETAWGYGKSEHVMGKVLADVAGLPRDGYHLMTKGNPQTAEDARRTVELQLKGLRTDRIDLYAWHGINNAERLALACDPGGPVAELHAMRTEGLIGDLGFSGHGPLDVIIDALATDLFSFVNLHYSYFFQRNAGAVAYAAAKDLGVFIISPNDKGGRLYGPNPTLRALTAPATPIQWQARWLLSDPAITTLSFGMTEPEHYAEMLGILPVSVPLAEADRKTLAILDARRDLDPWSSYAGYDLVPDPSGINIPEILRFRSMWKCYDLDDFVRWRYNMLEKVGHWFPGFPADEEHLAQLDLDKVPENIPLTRLLQEVHEAFYEKRDG